ncbi:transcriptional protein Swt1p [[Candida] railenensis]|uniref:Transcriptional protein SWT1 n=1 Tax=[Candida] railenensis TaxID=45579 RepID=A0A9P0QV44_9ASCO|nr:transcriptional protein Swt1p [[Candida] railenensis]
MSLPSRYAPEGLSAQSQKKIITVGKPRESKPIQYVIRRIENRIDDASNSSEDIEMIPMDDASEVSVISNYVTERRAKNDLPDLLESALAQLQSKSQAVQRIEDAKAYLVIDTNFILSHLNIVNGLKEIASNYNYQLVIPTTVISELDGLKNSERIPSSEVTGTDSISGKSVGMLARWANDWIYSSLADSNTIVRGQKVGEKIDFKTTKDDSILDCCLYLQNHHLKSVVVLMSNDKNFCLKALSNDILTVSYRPKMSAPLIAEMVQRELLVRFKPEVQHDVELMEEESIEDVGVSHQQEQIDYKQVGQPAQLSTAFSQKASLIHSEVEKLLIFAVKKCMKSNYGDDLDLVRNYDSDQITSIQQCSQLIGRFWQTVFSTYLRRYIKKDDITSGCFDNVPTDTEQFNTFLGHWELILKVLYAEEMDTGQNKSLAILIERWHNL